MKQRRKKNSLWTYIAVLLLCEAIWACSTTSAIPDGEQLFTGLKKIEFSNYEKIDYATATQEELGYVLASAPNGALFGSSYHRTLPYGLWIYNAFHNDEGGFAKWMTRSFGKAPVLMSQVNPELRATVAQTTLKAHGYFRGKVTASEVNSRHPKKGKVGYQVDMGHLFTIDTLHVIGGGSANDTMSRLTAAATGVKVVAGPTEATAIGNLMLQAKAAGIVKDRWQMREIISREFKVKTF